MFDGASGPTLPPQMDFPDDRPHVSAATTRFESCRWRSRGEDQPPHCTHRDVLPVAGTQGFTAEAWCGDCGFYKLRRTPRRSS